jgi:hypothetical protein
MFSRAHMGPNIKKSRAPGPPGPMEFPRSPSVRPRCRCAQAVAVAGLVKQYEEHDLLAVP